MFGTRAQMAAFTLEQVRFNRTKPARCEHTLIRANMDNFITVILININVLFKGLFFFLYKHIHLEASRAALIFSMKGMEKKKNFFK